MQVKYIFILFFLIFVLRKNSTKEKLSTEEIEKISGGLLNIKKMSSNTNFDTTSDSFTKDIDNLITENTDSDRTIIVNSDTSELKINKQADVEQINGKEAEPEPEQLEESGCNDVTTFGIVLVIIIYIVYHQINN